MYKWYEQYNVKLNKVRLVCRNSSTYYAKMLFLTNAPNVFNYLKLIPNSDLATLTRTLNYM